MKQLFSLLTFIFISSSVTEQTDSVIIGKYTFIEQKGIHGEPGMWVGNNHVTSYVSYVDTTITCSLLLNINHSSVLQIDTAVGLLIGFNPERKWLGKWEIINDTLIIKFYESSTLWPFSGAGEKTNLTIEKMTSQIIFEFVIKTYDNRIYGLELVNDNGTITYKKE